MRRMLLALTLCALGCGNTKLVSPGSDGRPAGDARLGGGLIDHVIVVVKENHTFDNYFGKFPGADGATTAKLSDGTVIPLGHTPTVMTRDLCHKHPCALTAWDHGKMDGLDKVPKANDGGDHLAFTQYDEADIPNYWAYARRFVLADHAFANVLGPSFPGHLFTIAAQAGWSIDNPSWDLPLTKWGCDDPGSTTDDVLDNGQCDVLQVKPCFGFPTIPDVLPKGISWRFYGSRLPPLLGEVWSMFDAINAVRNGPHWKTDVVPEANFVKDVQAGTLPNVTWLVDQDLDSEHPPEVVCQGENWTVDRLNAVMQSPLWKHTAIVITWDDWGGFYDHVPPPRQYGCDKDNPYGLGFRVPLLVVSPYAKRGYVMHGVAEQASIARMIERIFDAPTLSSLDPAAQDGQANDLSDAFDFSQPPQEPLVLPHRDCL